MSHLHKMVFVNLYVHLILYLFLDLAVAKSLQVFRMVTDDADVLTTTGYTGPYKYTGYNGPYILPIGFSLVHNFHGLIVYPLSMKPNL